MEMFAPLSAIVTVEERSSVAAKAYAGASPGSHKKVVSGPMGDGPLYLSDSLN